MISPGSAPCANLNGSQYLEHCFAPLWVFCFRVGNVAVLYVFNFENEKNLVFVTSLFFSKHRCKCKFVVNLFHWKPIPFFFLIKSCTKMSIFPALYITGNPELVRGWLYIIWNMKLSLRGPDPSYLRLHLCRNNKRKDAITVCRGMGPHKTGFIGQVTMERQWMHRIEGKYESLPH